MTDYAKTCIKCGKSFRITEFPFLERGGNMRAQGERREICRRCHKENLREIIKEKRDSARERNNIATRKCAYTPEPHTSLPSEKEVNAAERYANIMGNRLPTLEELKAASRGNDETLEKPFLAWMECQAGHLSGWRYTNSVGIEIEEDINPSET